MRDSLPLLESPHLPYMGPFSEYHLAVYLNVKPKQLLETFII